MWWALLLLVLPLVLLVACGFVIWSQPQNVIQLPFRVRMFNILTDVNALVFITCRITDEIYILFCTDSSNWLQMNEIVDLYK